MTDLTTTLTLSGVTDFKYDDSRGLLYLTTQSGSFYRWNPVSGTFADVAPVTLQGAVGGFDITPDGKYALVARTDTAGTYAQDIERIDLSTLAVEQLNLTPGGPGVNEAGAFDVAVMANGTALASTSMIGPGWEPLREFGAEDAVIAPAALSGIHAYAPALLAKSSAGRYVLVQDGNVAPGSIELLDSTTNTIVATAIPHDFGSSSTALNSGHADINENTGLVYWMGWVLDLNLHLVKDLTSLNSTVTNGHFSADGHQLYLWNAVAGQIQAYDTSSWQLEGSVAAPTTSLGALPNGALTLSHDGRLLFLSTGSTIGVIDLASRLNLTVQGDATHTQLYGSVGADVLTGTAANDTMTGAAGADTFVATTGTDVITDFSHAQGDKIDVSRLGPFFSLHDVKVDASQVGANTVISFGGSSLTLQGVTLANLTASDFIYGPGPSVGPGIGGTPTTGSGTINGTVGSDWLQGGSGNDTLHGGAVSDYLDGGLGRNTALYDGAFRQYTVTIGSPTTVADGPENGLDYLVNIQRIQFADGYLSVSPTDTAGQVYRVYEATLGRAPDQEGLTNWVSQLNAGASLQGVVNGFVNSTEFQNDYGPNLTNAQFVRLLYENVLHREPDQAGLDNWVGFMTNGMTRAQVVLGFSESPEDISDLSAPVQQGLWIADAAAGQVARMYDTVFGRLPDGGGLANWTHTLESGGSLEGVANGFVGSQEFQQTYGALNDRDFVSLLYANVLHRPPDAAGLTNWVNALAGGETRAQVVIGFSESPEHIGNMAPYIDSGVWLAG